MKIKKFFIIELFFLFFCGGNIFCFTPVATSNLLLGYIENDSSVKESALAVQKAQLSLDSEKINNGFDITLSTGNISFKFDNKNSFSMNPQVELKIPQASNMVVSLSTNLPGEKSNFPLNNFKFNMEINLLSSANLERQISLLKAQRTYDEAMQNLQNQTVNCEKSFYNDLKSILNSIDNVLSLQKTLYTNKIEFETVKSQEYSENSSTYRTAQLKILSNEYDIEKQIRSLIHSYIVFYKKCGYDISEFSDLQLSQSFDFFDLIPLDIQETEPFDIHSFDMNLFSEIEKAVWTNKINSMQRKSKSNFSLRANGGLTFSENKTIDAGLSSTIGGINLAADINVPIQKGSSSPSVTFSATVSPNNFLTNSIVKKTDIINEQQENLAIEKAKNNYETYVVEYEQKLNDLKWNKESSEEYYQMYSKIENDLEKWYKDGFVTESEYYSAKVNAQSYFLKTIINKIELIIYNDEILSLFVQ